MWVLEGRSHNRSWDFELMGVTILNPWIAP